VAVSACTSGASTAPPASFAPTLTTGTGSGPPTPVPAVTSGPPTPVPAVTSGAPTPVPAVTSGAPTPVPDQPAPLGGGGTAGFQDTLLLTLGAMAILAGAGGLIYRRWLGRGR
jgi:hypothetical protein